MIEFKPMQRNVLAVFRRANEDVLNEGMRWYREAFELAKQLDPANPHRAAGIIAAVSPMTPWVRNKQLAIRCFEEGGLSDGTLSRNRIKANRILAGEAPLDVLSGNKVRAFYQGIVNDPEAAVCIDRHAFDIAIGRITNDAARGVLKSDRVYREFETVYVRAAKRLGVTPTECQATTWTQWRIEKGIK